MAARGFGSGDRPADAQGRSEESRRRAVMHRIDCPRYMTERRLANGQVAYYWHPNQRDVAAGFSLACEGLGTIYTAAVERAYYLNQMLDNWRAGGGKWVEQDPTLFGSL